MAAKNSARIFNILLIIAFVVVLITTATLLTILYFQPFQGEGVVPFKTITQDLSRLSFSRFETKSLVEGYKLEIADKEILKNFTNELQIFSNNGAFAIENGQNTTKTINKIVFVLIPTEEENTIFSWPSLNDESKTAMALSRAYDNEKLEIRIYLNLSELKKSEYSQSYTAASIMGLLLSSNQTSQVQSEELQKKYFTDLDRLMGTDRSQLIFTIKE